MEKKGEVVVVVKDHEEEEALPGFRFHPTDEELVGFYLRRKVDKKPISIEIIKEMDIYKYDPWDLPKTNGGEEREWYFFCLRGRKYRNSIRPNRATGSGFWKATGIDRPIHSEHSNDCVVGLKKSLVYYRGTAGKGTKTDWMMHEFRLPSKNAAAATSPTAQQAEIWTICRIFKRNVSFMKKYVQDWKQAISDKQATADSGSKESSFESDARDARLINEQYSTNYDYEERRNYQILEGQYWNHAVQAPVAAPQPINVVDASANAMNTNEMLKDGNWDELGRIMEYITDNI